LIQRKAIDFPRRKVPVKRAGSGLRCSQEITNVSADMKSDTQLKQDVLDELIWDPKINLASDINVAVESGVVTLTGHVGSHAEKQAVGKAVQRIKGVRVLAADLNIRLTGQSKREDSDICRAAQRALDWNALVPGTVQAAAEKGWLTLSGEVQWDYQRSEAEKTVRYLNGLMGVSNAITLKPAVTERDLREGIQDALKRHADREAEKIQVIVDGTRVILRGKVDSFAEMKAVIGAAWAAPGVIGVTNELAVG
jgi:osmotically-inducible protein OsmY